MRKYEYNDNNFYAFRGDEIELGELSGLKGCKAIMAQQYCEKYPQGLVTCGSRFSIQVLMFARVCKYLNVPCIVCIPTGKSTDMIIKLESVGVEIQRIKPGYNTVLNARARTLAEERGYQFVPLGMLEETAYNIVADFVINNKELIERSQRIVVPVGSGTTLIGVAYGLKQLALDIPVLGVMVGMDATKNINKAKEYTEGINIELVKSEIPYDKEVFNDSIPELNKNYEAKCLEYIQENDLLWVVSE